MRIVRVKFSPEAEEVYNYLNTEAPNSKTEPMILDAVNKKSQLVKVNPHYGDPVAKKLIPHEYKMKYGANNLFRVELPAYWRMLYMLTNNDTEVEIIAFVLDIISHEDYNKKFGYRKI